MIPSYGIRERYRRLYQKIKSKIMDALDEARVPDPVREEIIEITSNLPHPRVASVEDIEEACKACVSGKLEYLYRYFGKDASDILNEIRDVIEKCERPPIPSERHEINDAINMLTWTNKRIFEMTFALQRIEGATDIILKSQCPYCHEDMVAVLVEDELRLRCKGQTKPECRDVDWYICNVVPRKCG
jgi:hypothetical protein